MKVSPEQLQAELLQLPTEVRARLAEALLASLDEPDAELDVAWGEEAERRSRKSGLEKSSRFPLLKRGPGPAPN